MKDLLVSCALIGGALWLLKQVEDGPASVAIPGFSAQILVVPVFLIGMYFTFTGKHSVIGLLMMGGVAWYLF